MLAPCVSLPTRKASSYGAVPARWWVGNSCEETAAVFHMKRHKAVPQGIHGRYLEGPGMGGIRPLPNFHPTV